MKASGENNLTALAAKASVSLSKAAASKAKAMSFGCSSSPLAVRREVSKAPPPSIGS
ncbi:MAG: hypothetical protein ACTS6G_04185 [Candidatus Hodgkinia cicadicola]